MIALKQFANFSGIAAAVRRAVVSLVPPPPMLPSEWAERNLQIPAGNAIPGPINFDNAPYQRGMLNAIKEAGVRRVSYMTGAQLGKTTVQQCATGYFIDHEPRSQIFAQPTQGDVQTFLETKLRPMIDANKRLAGKLAKQRGREGVNNSRMISYIGGWLMFCWSGSPKTARGRSAPVVHQDEIDGYEPSPEGDFSELLWQRAASFGDMALRTESSTPTIKGASRIETAFNEGDQRRYFVPCPHCGFAQYLKWSQVVWSGKDEEGTEQLPETALYHCEGCGTGWNDGERIAAIRNAEKLGHGWKAAKPFRGHASFHAPEMLSTFRRLRDIAQSYLDKMALNDLQSFVNVSLAETYEETGESMNPHALMDRREQYAAPVPAGALVLTAGVDMQPDRLEVELVGWGVGDESWSIDYATLWGDPDAGDVWDELEEYLQGAWQHETGVSMPISAACVDTGGTGGNTQSAYGWLRGKTGRRIFGTKGVPGWGKPIVTAPQRKQSGKTARKIDLFLVGADEAKLTVMRRLAVDKPGPGYCHFPESRDAEYFHQLTAEKLLTRYVKGFPVREWHKTRPRNEALDCRALALAALKIANPSMRRAADRLAKVVDGRQAAESFHAEPLPPADNDNSPPENPQEAQTPTAAQTGPILKTKRTLKSRKKRGTFATNW